MISAMKQERKYRVLQVISLSLNILQLMLSERLVKAIAVSCLTFLMPGLWLDDTTAAPPVQGISGVLLLESGQILYQLPDLQSTPNGIYPAQTPIQALAVYDAGGWLYVKIDADGAEGWVPEDLVAVDDDVSTLPVQSVEPVEILLNNEYWNFSAQSNDIFLKGQELGNLPDSFSKVGDSITVNRAFLQPFGKGVYDISAYPELQMALDFFNTDADHPTTSFTQGTRAAGVGWTTRNLLEPDTDFLCGRGDLRLTCEYRNAKSSFALIMIGTNDVVSMPVERYEENLRRIMDISVTYGVIPVLSTIPPQRLHEDTVRDFNLRIIEIAQDYHTPVWNYWLGLQSLPGNGMSQDGIHPSMPPSNAGTTIFTEEFLEYGYTLRNLMALNVLNLMLYQVMYI
jgi:hypothetical protein